MQRFTLQHTLLFLLTLTVASTAHAQRGGGGPVGVTVAVAERQEIAEEVEALGTLRANESVTITSNVTEAIQEIHFNDGKTVKKDALIVTLSNLEEKAEVAFAEANLEEQLREVERTRDLVRRKAVPDSQLDERETMVKTATHALEAAKARLQDRIIRAPFDGVVGLRRVSVGTLVTPGDPIITLDDISVVKLDFTIPETFISSVRKGMKIEASSHALNGQVFEGKVTDIDSRIDPVTRSATVRAVLLNDDGILKPGMLMEITLIKDKREALVIPEEAIIPIEDKHYVYRANNDNTVSRQEITIGLRKPGVVEVLSGLVSGERVVTHGTMKVSDGSAIEIKSAPLPSQRQE